MKNLSHNEAIDALCGCAATVTVLSYQEAIEGYFKLRGLEIPEDSDTQVRARALEEAAIAVEGVLERQPSIYEYALAEAASAIRALAGKEPS